MAAFFGGDHVVWAGGAGLVADKSLVERAQKLSFYGWLLGSLCQLNIELAELAKLRAARAKAKAVDAAASTEAADTALRHKMIGAAGVAAQATLAASLLGLLPLKPRAIGALGVTTSAIACWQLLPPLPMAPKAKDV